MRHGTYPIQLSVRHVSYNDASSLLNNTVVSGAAKDLDQSMADPPTLRPSVAEPRKCHFRFHAINQASLRLASATRIRYNHPELPSHLPR